MVAYSGEGLGSKEVPKEGDLAQTDIFYFSATKRRRVCTIRAPPKPHIGYVQPIVTPD